MMVIMFEIDQGYTRAIFSKKSCTFKDSVWNISQFKGAQKPMGMCLLVGIDAHFVWWTISRLQDVLHEIKVICGPGSIGESRSVDYLTDWSTNPLYAPPPPPATNKQKM